jgi:hypothetical protein
MRLGPDRAIRGPERFPEGDSQGPRGRFAAGCASLIQDYILSTVARLPDSSKIAAAEAFPAIRESDKNVVDLVNRQAL